LAKRLMKPTSDVQAAPTLLVSSGDGREKTNIIAVGWAGTLVSEPPTLAIGIRPGRYSYLLIKETGEFVVNVPTQEMLPEIDYCGTVSGRNVDKFKELDLTPVPASEVSAPLIAECPINVECRVVEHLRIGTHGIFLGEIVALHVDEDVLDERGNIDHRKVRMPLCSGGNYWAMGDLLGPFGRFKKK
jgi:flavin reductase (DIM6/NTAB) family NADH-FMN oxidoreductase RutF